MDGLLLILVLGGILGIILVFKQQPKGHGGNDARDEGSEE